MRVVFFGRGGVEGGDVEECVTGGLWANSQGPAVAESVAVISRNLSTSSEKHTLIFGTRWERPSVTQTVASLATGYY